MPGTFRSHERKGPDPSAEAQRVSIYLPAPALDLAEEQAMRAGVDTVQRYCEALLLRAIEEENARDRREEVEVRRGRLDGLLAIADDPDYLAEWTASLLDRPGGEVEGQGAGPVTGADVPEPGETLVERPAVEIVFRHAGLVGQDPEAFLPALRRGGPIGPEVGRELMQALIDLEAGHRGASTIDRTLAYALHKLAFEGQILTSEAWAGASVDEATVDVLRLVQEAVDRVLSGQDIRYYSAHDPSSPTPLPGH
ncbi:hypothetical protein [Tautonia plasticadhaerens]|uniref:Uncharacterized protein n=1 Tax=Tautonia plasticadhaerens TaxID=2527974 RepID=A0A518H8V5_9BACT|nr:hypothetical protein [Tautonia plasticadhaerens]QDV37270.1 hypothetical protein ElP_52050 [Tautonia plasticadhaerens]